MKNDPSLRILHLIHTPRHSGAESLARDICLLHSDRGITSAIASFTPTTPEFVSEIDRLQKKGVSLYLPATAQKKLGRVKHFHQAYRAFRPQVVFAHSVLPSFYGRLVLPFMGSRKPRFVTVLHSASNDDYAGGYLRAQEYLTRRLVDRIVAVSEEGATNYVRRFGNPRHVSVLKNGINLSRFQNIDRAKVRAQLGLDENTKMILQVGRLSSVKQQDLSIRSLADTLRGGRVELWLAGLTEQPAYEQELQALIESLGLGAKVRLLGSRTDVPELLSAADVYVMPSRAEAQSIALLEALASGAPAVISDIPSFLFCRQIQGVRIVGVEDGAAFSVAVNELLSAGRFNRDLSEYAIERVAERYSDFAAALLESKEST
jgi:glycosyltransferase involved in cell wall biosynthesis